MIKILAFVFALALSISQFSNEAIAQGTQIFGQGPNKAVLPIQTDALGNFFTIRHSGSTISADTPVSVSSTIALLLAADSTRLGFYANNAGSNNVALVPAGGSYANAAIILLPTETWSESAAPGAAWYVISQPAQTSTVNLMEIH